MFTYDHTVISFVDRTGQSLHKDLVELVRKQHSHHAAIEGENPNVCKKFMGGILLSWKRVWMGGGGGGLVFTIH